MLKHKDNVETDPNSWLSLLFTHCKYSRNISRTTGKSASVACLIVIIECAPKVTGKRSLYPCKTHSLFCHHYELVLQPLRIALKQSAQDSDFVHRLLILKP